VKVLDHAAHSTDLGSGDFHLFLHLKKHLAGQKVSRTRRGENEIATWLRAQAAEFCDIGVQKKFVSG
jgi:hypothetical protein